MIYSLPTLLFFFQELIKWSLSPLLSLFLKPFINETKNPKGNPMFLVATEKSTALYCIMELMSGKIPSAASSSVRHLVPGPEGCKSVSGQELFGLVQCILSVTGLETYS